MCDFPYFCTKYVPKLKNGYASGRATRRHTASRQSWVRRNILKNVVVNIACVRLAKLCPNIPSKLATSCSTTPAISHGSRVLKKPSVKRCIRFPISIRSFVEIVYTHTLDAIIAEDAIKNCTKRTPHMIVIIVHIFVSSGRGEKSSQRIRSNAADGTAKRKQCTTSLRITFFVPGTSKDAIYLRLWKKDIEYYEKIRSKMSHEMMVRKILERVFQRERMLVFNISIK